MNDTTNGLGQPIGFDVPDWQACAAPPRKPIDGRTCRIEAIDPERHAADLFAAITFFARKPFHSDFFFLL